jgi:integrase
VDFLRRRVLVAESVTPVRGVMTFGPTKGHERREVPLRRFLVDDLARHVEGRKSDDLVFTGWRGAVMWSRVFQRAALIEAAAALGIPGFHPHELRHTAASLAIASGADVKVVQQMLGHKSAVMSSTNTATFWRPARRCGRCNGCGAGASARRCVIDVSRE